MAEERIKFPSIPYLEFSPGRGADDEPLQLGALVGVPLVVTVKMDGSNVQLRNRPNDGPHAAARNGTVADHPSFSRLKARAWELVCESSPCRYVFGEWLYAKHSIHYRGELALPDYFMLFGVYHSCIDQWGSWEYVERVAKQMKVPTPASVQRVQIGSYLNLKEYLAETAEGVVAAGHEGIVVRVASGFSMEQFGSSIGKYVRPDHVQTDEHWRHKPIVPNELKEATRQKGSER